MCKRQRYRYKQNNKWIENTEAIISGLADSWYKVYLDIPTQFSFQSLLEPSLCCIPF